jgi:hypothetical protein
MMENMKITKENYEAYCLDALEGTLSTDEHALLQFFLENHPELVVDLEDFLQLAPLTTRELPSDFLGALKHIDFANDSITDDNVEQYCIAHSEGILTAEKKAELQQFVKKNKTWSTVFQKYEQSKLQPRKTDVHPNPADLKRRERRLLPLYFTVGAAAALVLTFLMYPFNGNDAGKSSVPTIANQQKDTTKTTEPLIKNLTKQADLGPHLIRSSFANQHKETEHKVYEADPLESSEDHSPAPLLSQQNVENTSKDDSLAIAHVPQHTVPITHTVPVRVNLPATKKNDLVNPIFPVTNALSAMLNTEIDFGKTQNNVADNRGFYLKIGKFEVSRNARR